MLASLRKTLIDSHIAAVTIAGILLFSVEGIYCAAYQFVSFLILFTQLVVSHQIWRLSIELQKRDSVTLSCLIGASAAIFCAWLLSHWAFGVGPLRSLALYRKKLSRSWHA